MQRTDSSVAICTACDAPYFALLDGLIASLEDAHLPENWRIHCMDLGLTSEQQANLKSRKVLVCSPEWSINFPGRDQTPGWFRAMINRPFLPKHFPGSETYLWLDADSWVHQSDCLFELVKSAAEGQIALVLEKFGPGKTYHTIGPDGKTTSISISEASSRANLEQCYRKCFGEDTAHYATDAVTNSGVFALRSDSPVWQTWAEYLIIGVQRAASNPPIPFLVEQQSLNLGHLQGRINIRPVPWRFNWTMNTLHPVFDPDSKMLVDPNESNQPLGIVHLNRLKHAGWIQLKTTTGDLVKVPLTYRHFAAQFRSSK